MDWPAILRDVLTWHAIVALIGGTIAGLFVGALPGIGPAVGISLLLPLSYFLPVGDALLFYVSLYQAAEYGGSITAIAIRTPGAPNSAAMILDGYPLNQKGQSGKAFAYSLWSAIFASYVGIAGLFLLSQPISGAALALGPAAFAALGLFGLTAVATLSIGSPLKGIIAGLFGILLSTVGTDLITNVQRFTFRQPALYDGVPLLAVLVGVFALPEAIRLLTTNDPEHDIAPVAQPGQYRVWLHWSEFVAVFKPMSMGTIVGFFMGLLPGVAGTVPPWITYNIAKAMSRRPERFGTGEPEGIVAPEATNAAVMHSTLIPAFTLGIPGTPTSAVILGAMVIGGLHPGPLLFTKNPAVVYELFCGLVLSTAALWVIGLLTTQLWARMTAVPKKPLAIAIVTLCITGVFVSRLNPVDIWICFVFGALGYAMDRYGFSVPALVLGLILGSITETNMRQALLISSGNLLVFLQDPISLAFLLLAAIAVWGGFWLRKRVLKQTLPDDPLGPPYADTR